MGFEKLKSEYGKNLNVAAAINRAIRAECAGGDEAIDMLTLIRQIGNRHLAPGWQEGDDPLGVLYRRTLGIIDAMEDFIREEYQCPPRIEREDGQRSEGRRRGGHGKST